MTEENDWYYEPFSEEIWYENEWGDESFYGKGGKFNNRKSGKGKYSKGKGKFPFRKGYEVEQEGNKGLGKDKKGFGKSKLSGKEEAHVAGDMPAAEGAQQTADGATWNSSPHGYSYEEYYDSITGQAWYTEDGYGWYKTPVDPVTGRTFLATEIKNEVYLAGIGRWQKVDCMKHATYVIIDSGCTRAMGSRPRIMAFVAECRRNAKCKLWFEFKPCYAQFSFANSQKSRVYERLVIHFPTEPPCSTEIEILEEGCVPILLSLEQMRNLYMKFEHTPECDYLTCAAFGMKDFPIPVSTTNHLLLDLAAMKNNPTGCGKVVECTWLTESSRQGSRTFSWESLVHRIFLPT